MAETPAMGAPPCCAPCLSTGDPVCLPESHLVANNPAVANAAAQVLSSQPAIPAPTPVAGTQLACTVLGRSALQLIQIADTKGQPALVITIPEQ